MAWKLAGVTGLVLATLTGAARAQAPAPAPSRLAELQRAADAVAAARMEPVNRGTLSGALQTYGNVVSFVGDGDAALAALDEAMRGSPLAGRPGDIEALGDIAAADAIDTIVAAARDKRAVLINESHHQPLNRAFTQKLAAELRKIGYTYFAAEAFDEPVSRQPAYVTAQHGYYVREPAFATMVNQALADGWILVPYDTTRIDPAVEVQQRMRQREIDAANLIYERIFARDPNAKALIHVGYGHLYRDSAPASIKMGTLLREKLGDGATVHVDQTQFFAHPDRSRENVLYRPLLARFGATAPFILRRADGTTPLLLNRGKPVDMQVVFPDYGTVAGRPGWMRTLAGRQPLPVPAALLPTAGKRLIVARARAHGDDAVPLDAVLLEAGKPAPPLMVPPGDMRLSVEE